MDNANVNNYSPSPEEKELEQRNAELKSLEIDLAQRELNLNDLRLGLQEFENTYQKLVGVKFLELDKIEAQINEYMELLSNSSSFKPSENLKQLYREVAKQVHPDLATNEKERIFRKELMAEANEAYENCDEERLRTVLEKWKSSPESITGEGVALELVRVLRKISQVKDRIIAIEEEIASVKESNLYQLKRRTEKSKEQGIDLLKVMADEITQKIIDAKDRLEKVMSKINL